MDQTENRCREHRVDMKKIEKISESLPSTDKRENLAAMYKALGDPTRLGIMLALKKEELCVCELSCLLDISESATSHQLRGLRQLKLVKKRRDAQKLYYSIDDEHVDQILEIGLIHQAHI